MAFDRLLEDPMAALGYGLLVSPQNPLATGFDALTKAQGAQRARDEADFERQYKIADLQRKIQTGEDLPSNVQEYQYYNSLPDDEKARYLAVKRAQQVVNLGGTQAVLNPMGGGIKESFPVTPKPEDMPDFKGAQAQASAQGKAVGEAQGNLEKKAINAPYQLSAIQQARELLPKASSGALETAGSAAANFFGQSTEGSKANRQLSVLGAELTNNVPRMEGPQSNADMIMYKQAAADIGNSMVPYEDRVAALSTVESIARKYMGQGQQIPQAQPTTQETPSGSIKFLGFE